MSKLPFVIAEDQGLYEKHGLDVELWLRQPEFEGGIERGPPFWPRVWRLLGLLELPDPDILVQGHTPRMVQQMRDARAPKRIALAATDCSVRYYVIGRPGINSLEELKGQRLGIDTYDANTVGFAALRMVQRMGWDRVQDISIMDHGGGGDRGIAGGPSGCDCRQRCNVRSRRTRGLPNLGGYTGLE